jgi:hypothetical protein
MVAVTPCAPFRSRRATAGRLVAYPGPRQEGSADRPRDPVPEDLHERGRPPARAGRAAGARAGRTAAGLRRHRDSASLLPQASNPRDTAARPGHSSGGAHVRTVRPACAPTSSHPDAQQARCPGKNSHGGPQQPRWRPLGLASAVAGAMPRAWQATRCLAGISRRTASVPGSVGGRRFLVIRPGLAAGPRGALYE